MEQGPSSPTWQTFRFSCAGRDDTVLDRESVQSRLHLPADQQFSRPESELVRTLYDCPDVAVGPDEQRCRVVVATHPASKKKSPVGLTRSGVVYELFFTALPRASVYRFRCRRTVSASRRITRLSFQMKTTNRIPIAGALTRPGDRNAGNWSRNGSGTSALSVGASVAS